MTIWTGSDNTANAHWNCKGSTTTTTGPAAHLVQVQALHQQEQRHVHCMIAFQALQTLWQTFAHDSGIHPTLVFSLISTCFTHIPSFGNCTP